MNVRGDKMIITISGIPGSGKTTVGRILAKRLGYKFYSMGDLRGKTAMDRGLTIDQLNELGEKEDWTDKEVDEYQQKLGREEDNFIVDGWISWHFIPHSFKVLLEVGRDEAARRVFRHQRPDEERKATVAGLKEMLDNRVRESNARYRKYYKISDFLDRGHYDLVVDTDRISAVHVAGKILEAVKRRKGAGKPL